MAHGDACGAEMIPVILVEVVVGMRGCGVLADVDDGFRRTGVIHEIDDAGGAALLKRGFFLLRRP